MLLPSIFRIQVEDWSMKNSQASLFPKETLRSTESYVTRPRKSPFIRYFTKTPEGIVCPHFWLLAWADGCPYHCDYCYLQGTPGVRYQMARNGKPVVYSNTPELLTQCKEWMKQQDQPALLNAGELCDSLALTDDVMIKVAKLFWQQEKHKLLLLTKSANVEGIVRVYGNVHSGHSRTSGQVIVSFSLNPLNVSSRFEHDAASIFERLDAAKKCKEAGLPVRIRVDPIIVPYDLAFEQVERSYEDLAAAVNALEPERVTLGSLRVFPIVFSEARKAGRNMEVFNGLNEITVDGRHRYALPKRMQLYRFMMERLKGPAALCKETNQIHALLKPSLKCNCVI